MKLGRLPAVRPAALSDLAVYAVGKLPAPPDWMHVPRARYPIDGNDAYGDCTIAGVAHMLAAWNAEVGEHDLIPSEQDVVSTYFQLTGGADSGLAEADVLKTWRTDGLFGEQIAAYAPVLSSSILALHQAVAFYGGCYLGIVCPLSAQQQFESHQEWTYIPNSPIEGGHCIVALGYDSHSLKCATWGGIASVNYQFLAHYLQEAWCILSHQMVEAKGDALGIDLATLQADLTQV